MKKQRHPKHQYSKETLARRRREEKRMQIYKVRRKARGQVTLLKNLKVLFRLSCIILIFWGITRLMYLPQWYLDPAVFLSYPNKSIKIEGAEITTPKHIMEVLKKTPVPTKPIYLVNTKKYEKQLEKLSPVRKAFIRRFWFPARLEIIIDEKTPILTIAPSPTAPDIAAIADDTGIIEREYLPIDRKKYPTYKVLTFADYTQWKTADIKELTVLLKTVENASKESIKYIDLRAKDDIFIQLETVRVRLGETNSTVLHRAKRLSSIMPQIENLKHKIEYIDLRWEDTTSIKLKEKQSYKLN